MFVEDVLASTGREGNFEPMKFNNSDETLISLSSSSGTSGPAKPVSVSQSYILQFAEMFKEFEFRRIVHFGPIMWNVTNVTYCLFVILPLTNLTRVVTRRLGSVENYFEFVDKFKIECLFTTPSLLLKTLQSPLTETVTLPTLKMVMSIGAILHPDLRIKFKKRIFRERNSSHFMVQPKSILCFRVGMM